MANHRNQYQLRLGTASFMSSEGWQERPWLVFFLGPGFSPAKKATHFRLLFYTLFSCRECPISQCVCKVGTVGKISKCKPESPQVQSLAWSRVEFWATSRHTVRGQRCSIGLVSQHSVGGLKLTWMICNKLKLNRDETEILVLSVQHRPRPHMRHCYNYRMMQ